MTAKKSSAKSKGHESKVAPETVETAGVPSTSIEAAPEAKPVKSAKVKKGAGKTSAKVSPTRKVTKAPKAKVTPKPKAKAPQGKAQKTEKPVAKKVVKAGLTTKKADAKKPTAETAQILDSVVAYEGPLFRVVRDHIIEPGGQESHKDVIKHNGSVVILAVDPGKKKKDPWIVIERQYRHAAGQFLWELPAGKLDAGETPMDGAKRELSEETGYSAKTWSPLVEYFASPGFLGEAMKVFLAEGLIAGDAHPEEDEKIDFRLVKLSELLAMVEKGKIIDGKTLTTVLLYARKLGVKRKG